MQTLIFTGTAGVGIATAAAATACAAAAGGVRTLLVSIGPSHSLDALFGSTLGGRPHPVAPHLEAWAIDALGDMGRYWQELSARFSAPPPVTISGDELPVLPGADLYVSMAGVLRHARSAYDLLVLDAGPHDGLLRALAVPDSLRWGVRLLFGLDRGPGRSYASLGRALVPAALLPFETPGQIQDLRVRLEAIRDDLIDPRHTSVRYVLRPDAAGLDEAHQAVPALQLFGLTVETIIAGPLLPEQSPDAQIAAVAANQVAIAATAAQTWAPRPLLRLPLAPPDSGAAALATLGAAIYGRQPPTGRTAVPPPIEQSDLDPPFIAISLPGARRDALGLTLSGDELIVRVGPYRRHVLMPEGLRSQGTIKATREGDRLVVRLRPS